MYEYNIKEQWKKQMNNVPNMNIMHAHEIKNKNNDNDDNVPGIWYNEWTILWSKSKGTRWKEK